MELTETIKDLHEKGYETDFNLIRNQPPNFSDFVVDDVYRIDINTDPADQSVLYAVRCKSTGEKGIIINGFGIYSDPLANELIASLQDEADDSRTIPKKAS